MYINRKLEKILKEVLKQFPACLITGPRQSGKSTLLKHLLKDHEYVTFDDARIRKMAKDDPELFLSSHETPIIIDEIQYVPELLPYIKIKIDKNRNDYGRYIFTGSQSFQLMQEITEKDLENLDFQKLRKMNKFDQKQILFKYHEWLTIKRSEDRRKNNNERHKDYLLRKKLNRMSENE